MSGHKINPFLASLSWSPSGLRTAGDPAGPATRVWREPDTETRPHGTSQRASAHVRCEHSRQQPTSVRSRGKRQECGLRLHLRVCVFVAQSCPTLCDPKDCSLPDSFAHGDSPGKNTGVGCHLLLQGIFPTHGVKPRSPALQADSLPFNLPKKPLILVGIAINTGCWVHEFLISFSQSCR